jgi:helix-turn-helix protein
MFCVQHGSCLKWLAPFPDGTGSVRVGTYPARQRAVVAVIRDARREAGLSQRVLSLRLGEHHTFLSRIERLERDVTVAEFVAIAKALELDPLELLRRVLR